MPKKETQSLELEKEKIELRKLEIKQKQETREATYGLLFAIIIGVVIYLCCK